MMGLSHAARRSGCYLGDAAPLAIVNQAVTIVAGAGKLAPGTVLGVIAASGKYAPHDPSVTNGAQTAAAVLFHAVDATDQDAETIATTNGPATLRADLLTYAAGISDADRRAADEALTARGFIIPRDHD